MSAQPQMNEWCIKCSQPVDRLHPITGWCYVCSRSDPYLELEVYLEQNADHLEYYIAKGFSFYHAVRHVSTEVRPSCLSCGVVLNRAPRNALFCTKNERCNKMRNRYTYLYKKGMNKSLALSIVIKEFNKP